MACQHSDHKSTCPKDTGKCPADMNVSIYLDGKLVKELKMTLPQYNGFWMCYSVLNKEGKYSVLVKGIDE
jgi:hypothetical protein